jgi:hypothetical protein
MKIESIDYDKTFRALFPKLVGKLKTVENPRFSIRFLRKMGEEVPDAFQGVLNRLSQRDKDEFLLFAVRWYRAEWIVRLKDFLSGHFYGKNLDFDDISLARDDGEGMVLLVKNLVVDYRGLMESGDVERKANELVNGLVEKRPEGGLKTLLKLGVPTALRIAKRLPTGLIDSGVLSFLRDDANKRRVVETLTNAVCENGAHMIISDAEFVRANADAGEADEPGHAEDAPELPESLADALLDALSGYIKTMNHSEKE